MMNEGDFWFRLVVLTILAGIGILTLYVFGEHYYHPDWLKWHTINRLVATLAFLLVEVVLVTIAIRVYQETKE